jgi:hypothetical protein
VRTTVSLDSDTERMVRDAMQKRGVSFKVALNDAIRAGLASAKQNRGRKFTQETFPLGPEQYFRWDKALSEAEAMEDEEIVHKLSLRK